MADPPPQPTTSAPIRLTESDFSSALATYLNNLGNAASEAAAANAKREPAVSASSSLYNGSSVAAVASAGNTTAAATSAANTVIFSSAEQALLYSVYGVIFVLGLLSNTVMLHVILGE